MDFLKKHYEKVLLGLILAGLVGVLVFMLFYIADDQQKMDDRANTLTHPRVSKLPDLDLAVLNSAMGRLKTPYRLDLETTNKLFNPLEWQKTPDGRMIPINSDTVIGVRAVVVTNIIPLYLIISLDAVTTNDLGARYTIGVQKQAAAVLAKRQKQARYVSVGDKANDVFALVEVKGPPENPDALVLKLVDSGETVTVSREKPYRHVEAYSADFRYDLERRIFRGRRIGDKVSFGGTDYVVADVTEHELTLTDQSNQKKNTLPFTP